jgi:porphobilinogen synthase
MTQTIPAPFPALRLRRTRATGWSRALHRENILTPADLIWPLFVTEGTGVEDPIASLPGVSRWSVDGIVARAKEAVAQGIPVLRSSPTPNPNAAARMAPRRLTPTI